MTAVQGELAKAQWMSYSYEVLKSVGAVSEPPITFQVNLPPPTAQPTHPLLTTHQVVDLGQACQNMVDGKTKGLLMVLGDRCPDQG